MSAWMKVLLHRTGEVDVAKVEPISFDPFNNKYVKVTEIVGNAFSDGKELM